MIVKRPPLIEREHGFGLVDVIVATLVSGVLVALLAGIVVTVFTSVRVSDENFKGDDDVQLVLLTLSRDVEAGSPSCEAPDQPQETCPRLIKLLSGGQQLELRTEVGGKFARVTYTYAADGTLTRKVEESGVTTRETTVARNLKKGITTPLFAFCPSSAVCPSPELGPFPFVSVKLTFVVRGTDVVRTITVAPRLGTTP